mmetsp:Transcript_42470/g.40712  ORF Transcript_42470/g.40712 Transcript_42470/m.40712 type:complete len:169 (+) Transcript_42470:1605-2111(+)
MVSSPTSLTFEFNTIDMALDLLEAFGKAELLKRTSLETDQQRFNKEQDYRMKFVLLHNIQLKKIFHSQLKLLRVMKAILERIQVGQESFSRATFKPVPEIEQDDDKETIFRRRMSLREYFKNLKMNMGRIKKNKAPKGQKEFKEEGEGEMKQKKVVSAKKKKVVPKKK